LELKEIRMSYCKICGEQTQKIFQAQILYKYNVSYYQCIHCRFGQTEDPYWLEDAYKSSMNISDTGVMHRCYTMSKVVTSLLFFYFGSKGKYLDYAGGYGAFTRRMRDIGFDFYWHDPYTPNVIARGFEGSLDQKYDAVTTFESFEHFENPQTEIDKILALTDTIILTTDTFPYEAPPHKDWWYYGSEHGQHLSFYTKKTFEYIAAQKGLFYINTKNVHVLTRKKPSFLGKLFFSLPFKKHLLYFGYYFAFPFLTSKSMSDMNSFYQKKCGEKK